MAQHIGIVALQRGGAALCYRTICLEGSERMGPHNHPEVSLHNHPLAEYMKFITRDDWAGVAELMMSSAEKLARTGADFLICPDIRSIRRSISLLTVRRGRGCTLPRWSRRGEAGRDSIALVFSARST